MIVIDVFDRKQEGSNSSFIVSTNSLGKLTILHNLFSLGFAAIFLSKVYDDTSLDHVNRRTGLEADFQRPACCPA